MAQAWVLLEFTDGDGKHEVGDKIDLPRNTDQEKADFDRLVAEGVVTTSEPNPKADSGSRRARS